MAVFTVIDHTEFGAAAASWTKSSIPSSYDHLYLLASLRTERADYFEDGKMTLNGDTGSNYAYATLRGGSGSSGVTSTGDHGIASLPKWNMAGASAAAGTFGTISMWIPNYAGTVGWKPLILNWGASTANDAVSRYSVGEYGGLWYDTSAIDEITIATNDGEDIAQYSTFTLYGVTGA